MRISAEQVLGVVCLSTVLVGTSFVRNRMSPAVHGPDQREVAQAGARALASAASRHRIRPVRAIARAPMPAPEDADPSVPAAAIEHDPDRSSATRAFAAFDRWLEEYLPAVPGPGVADREAEGEALALQRRSALKDLIESDPEHALRLAVPASARKKLPAAVAQHLEERISGLGRLDVIAYLPTPGTPEQTSATERFVSMNDRSYKAFVYGRRATQPSKEAIPLHGIAIGNVMAVHESPVRLLEAGEAADPALPGPSDNGHCPVSKAAGDPSAAVQVGNEIFRLCHAGHIEVLTRELEAREAGVGPIRQASVSPANQNHWTQGAKTVLFMRVNFADDLEESIPAAAAQEMMRQVNDFFMENSYGTLSFDSTVTPLLTMPRPKSWYAASREYFALLDDARAAAQAAGFATASFDFDAVHVQRDVIGGSRAFIGAKGAWIEDRDPSVACHEFGHNLRLEHANAWITTDGSVIGPGSNRPYGNPYDTMGGGRREQYHFNVYYKHLLNWVPDAAIQSVTADGVYRLHPFDVPRLNDGLIYGLRIQIDSERAYWIETRQMLSDDPRWLGSLLLNWSAWSGSEGGSQLLDMTPNSEGARWDAPLLLGRSFYDPALGLKIIPWKLGGTTPESIDVLVKHVHYLTATAESGALVLPVTSQSGAALTVDIPVAGEYVIWCRVRATDSGPIAVAATIDGESAAANLAGVESSGGQWLRLADPSLHDSSGAAPKSFPLPAGRHTIQLSAGNQNTVIDAVLVTDDPTTSTPPIISPIANQVATVGSEMISLPFTVTDLDTPLAGLKLSARSSNPSLVPHANIGFDGGELSRTVTITLAPDQLGTAVITLAGTQPGGDASSVSFSLTVVGAVQALVNAAAPGDTVIVPPGTYLDRVIIDKDLTLQGYGRAETVIDGNRVNIPLTIMSNATVTLRNLTLRNGRGGLRNYGIATLIECAIRDNQAGDRGGGIWNRTGASLFLESCTVSSNSCTGAGGGGAYNDGDFTAVNTTFSGNRATAKDDDRGGGGIYNAKRLTAYHCTITQNRAARGGGVLNTGMLQLGNCIVAGNTAERHDSHDFLGALMSAGFNLMQSANGWSMTGELTGNIIGQDPRLGPLQDNGGATWTHALLPDSPAIDRGNADEWSADQRGYARPRENPGDARADIGAFEFFPEVEAEPEFTSIPPQLILRRGAGGEVTLLLSGSGNWIIQATSDFQNWEDVAVLNQLEGETEFTDPAARDFEKRFYRALKY